MRKNPIQTSTAFDETDILSQDVTIDPAQTEIARLAYQLWTERGRPDGSADEDWFRAQDLLRSGRAVSASSSAP